MHPIDVKEIILEAVNEFQSTIISDKIKISFVIQQSVPLYIDKECFRVMLSNLFSNAIHFRDQAKDISKITIRVRASLRVCKIQILDNGIGISADTLPNIFQLFYCGTAKSTGSGVGLYIVRQVLNKMSGAISVRSTEGKGSTFNISIPNISTSERV